MTTSMGKASALLSKAPLMFISQNLKKQESSITLKRRKDRKWVMEALVLLGEVRWFSGSGIVGSSLKK